jgi:hypothetical protein
MPTSIGTRDPLAVAVAALVEAGADVNARVHGPRNETRRRRRDSDRWPDMCWDTQESWRSSAVRDVDFAARCST